MTLEEARSLRDGQVLHSNELHILECYFRQYIQFWNEDGSENYQPAIRVVCPPIDNSKVIPITDLSLGKKQFGSGQHHLSINLNTIRS